MPSIPSSRTPSARYDEQGNLYVDFPSSVQRSVLFPPTCRMIAGLAPSALHDWEPSGHDTVFIDWTVSRQVERHLRTLWPALPITAKANSLCAGELPQPEALAFFNDDHSLRAYMPLDGGFAAMIERQIPRYAWRKIEGRPTLPMAYLLDAEYALIALNSIATNWPTALVTAGIEAGR